MNFNWDKVGYTIATLGEGMGMTCAIFFLTLIISLPLGFLVCFGRMSKNKVLRAVVKFYIDIMRGTPLMLQLMIVYFAPSLVFAIRISAAYRFPAVIIAFAINYAAYFAEIYRGGIESIEEGQYEAAQLLGFNKTQTFLRIILPQVIKRVLPSVTNEIVVLVKDTSLAYAIAVTEMFTIAKQVASQQASMLPYAVAFVFYFLFNWVVAKGMEWVEKKFSYYSN